MSWKTVVARLPSGSVNSPAMTGEASGELASHGPVALAVPAERMAGDVAREEPVIGAARIAHHQPGRVGVAGEEIEIDAIGLQQLMDERQDEEPVGAGIGCRAIHRRWRNSRS